MLKKLESFFVWVTLFSCCFIVLSMIAASKLYPAGNYDNKLIMLLLKNITIQTVAEDDHWQIKYPLIESRLDQYTDSFTEYKKIIENYCTTSFPGGELINSLVSSYNSKIMHYGISEIPCIGDDQNYVKDCVQNIVSFKEELDNIGIPFFYVQTPSKESIAYYASNSHEYSTVAGRNYCLTSALCNKGIDVINIAKDHPDGITFDSTSHWMPTDSLICTRLISERLSTRYSFNIDPSMYDDSRFYDIVAKYPDIKNSIDTNTDYDFVLPCPNGDVPVTIEYLEEERVKGDFKSVLFNEPEKWDPTSGAYHNVFSISNTPMTTIYNDNTPCNKHVLIIGDSFTWPICTYLSLACSRVTLLHNASFNGSIISYIKKNSPDIVIIIYNDAELFEIYTKDAYYLK